MKPRPKRSKLWELIDQRGEEMRRDDREVHTTIAFMRDTAASYREEAKRIFKRIEECALFTEDVRKTCETVRRRIMEDRSIA